MSANDVLPAFTHRIVRYRYCLDSPGNRVGTRASQSPVPARRLCDEPSARFCRSGSGLLHKAQTGRRNHSDRRQLKVGTEHARW